MTSPWDWRGKLLAVAGNLRPVRSAVFAAAVVIGGAAALDGAPDFRFWGRMVCAVMAVFFSWQTAVVVNDLADEKIDRISNTGRPLPAARLNSREYAYVAVMFAGLALSFAVVLHAVILVLIAGWLGLGLAYSLPPVRVRQTLWGNAVIGAAMVLTYAVGVVAVAGPGPLCGPGHLVFGGVLFVFATLVTLCKDLKDTAGDRQADVVNVFSLYGREKGKRIVCILLGLVMMSPAVFLRTIAGWAGCAALSAATVWAYDRFENERVIYVLASLDVLGLFLYLRN